MLLLSQRLFIIYGPAVPSPVYCIFAQLTNTNVLGKLSIHDSSNKVNWKLHGIGYLGKNTIHTCTRDGEGPYL